MEVRLAVVRLLILLAVLLPGAVFAERFTGSSSNVCIWDMQNERCTWNLLEPFARSMTRAAEQPTQGVDAQAAAAVAGTSPQAR